ncbi:YfeC-like transcriptional regulator [Nostocoides veronense]
MAIGQPMDTMTPRELAKELGVSDRTIRQWLREQGWQSVPYARWRLTPEQARQVREHFRA